MVTIRDVAKESGFSSTTVSIVLNNAPLARYIPAVTKKRIERAAQKLGYRPNQFARSLRSKRSHTVGVMVFDMTDPFRALSGNVARPPHRSPDCPGQLALSRYQLAGRSRKEQHSNGHDRLRTEDGVDQFGDRRQRGRRPYGARTSALSRPP